MIVKQMIRQNNEGQIEKKTLVIMTVILYSKVGFFDSCATTWTFGLDSISQAWIKVVADMDCTQPPAVWFWEAMGIFYTYWVTSS